jgi:hypothetical protein
MRFLPLCSLFLLLFASARALESRKTQTARSFPDISSSGTEFLEVCKHIDEEYSPSHVYDDAICLGWTQGFLQGVLVSEEFRRTPEENRMTCPPSEVTVIQFIRVIKKHMIEQPERAHLASRYLASEALITAFPCKK